MRAREAVASRGWTNIAAASQAATSAGLLLVLQTQRNPEDLAADTADEKHDMLIRVAEHVKVNKLHTNGPTEIFERKLAAATRSSSESRKRSNKCAADRERMQECRHDESICGLEVRYNLCAITQAVCQIRNACLLFQNAVRRERRADPAVRESVVSLLNKSQSVHVDDLFNVNDARTLLF